MVHQPGPGHLPEVGGPNNLLIKRVNIGERNKGNVTSHRSFDAMISPLSPNVPEGKVDRAKVRFRFGRFL